MSCKKVGDYYLLLQEIGRGNFSSVWLGVDTRTNQELAFKVLSVDKFDSTLKNYLVREIEVMRSVDSPYIVKLLDVVRTAKNVYLALELCKGGSIGDYLKTKGPIPLHLARLWLLQIVDAFINLSAQRIVHRDLKLENVLLSSENEEEAVAKLADFGLTRVLNSDSFILQTAVGSPLYMAPEILMRGLSNTKVDVWSFGVLANNMLGGPLFRNLLTIPQLISAQKTSQRDIAQSDLADSIKELLFCTLRHDPVQRPTFQEIRNLRFFTDPLESFASVPWPAELPQTEDPQTAASQVPAHEDHRLQLLQLNYRLKEELERVASIGVEFERRKEGLVVIAVYQCYVKEVEKCVAAAIELQRVYNPPELQQLMQEAEEQWDNGKCMLATWQSALSIADFGRNLVHFDTSMWVEPRILKETADVLLAEAEAAPDRIEKLRMALYLLHLGKEDEQRRLATAALERQGVEWTPIGDSWDQLMESLLTEIKAAELSQA